MKRTFILFTFSAAIAALTLSNASGPASNSNGNKTGGPGSTGTCTSCHSGASGATGSVALRLKSDNSPAGGQYKPGQTYVVTVSGAHASLPKFGFQLMALKESGNTQAGSFGNLGTNQHSATISGITLIEQHHALAKTGTEFKTEFEWTAPAAGTGNIKFYGVLNAVDGTGSTNADAVSPAFNLTLAEAANGVNDITAQPVLSVYPNPVKGALQINVTNNGSYLLKVYSLDSKLVLKEQVEVNSKTIRVPIDLVPGTYILDVTNGTERFTTPFIKE